MLGMRIQKDKVVGFRTTEQDFNLMRKLCDLRGEDVSDFIRRSVKSEFARLGFSADEDRKALGLKPIYGMQKGEEGTGS